jgi:putative ABC transport system permease protein
MVSVSPDYFRAMGIPIVQGRPFVSQDTSDQPSVCVVGASLARHFWGAQTPIGKRLRTTPNAPWSLVVGVVGDVHSSGLDADPEMVLYVPLFQRGIYGVTNVVVQARLESVALLNEVRTGVQSLDPDLPVYNAVPMEQRISNSLAPRRFATFFVGSFAGMALFLAVIGMYGVISSAVAQRTHEIGLRMALGATRTHVLWLIVSRGFAMVLCGLLLGIPATLVLTRFVSEFMFDVSVTDPEVLAVVAVLLSVVAILACCIPARRATRVDPMIALRHE